MNHPVTVARARWHSAGEQLFPALLADPAGYQRALTDIQAVVAELRRRGDDEAVLLAAAADPPALLAEACPAGSGLPADIAVGVACSVRERELNAEARRRQAERTVAEARAAGQPWAVLAGPEKPAELSGEGDAVALHLPTGTVVTATVDMWSGGPPYLLQIAPPEGEPACLPFTGRADWLEAYERCMAELSDASPAASERE